MQATADAAIKAPGAPAAGHAGAWARDHRLLGLELLRFLAALSVLLWHYQHFGFDAGVAGAVLRPRQPFYGWLRPFYERGYLGVQVFWCISGFIFFWKYGPSIAARQVGAWRFFVLRFSRLYPLHLVTLLLVAALQPLYRAGQGHDFVYQHNDLVHFVRQLLLVSNWADPNDWSFNGPIWSISVEVLVYGLFFALMRSIGPSRVGVAAVAAVCSAAMLAQVPWPVFACAAFFFAGGLAALGLRVHRWPELPWVVGAVLVVAAVAVRRPAPGALAFVCLLTLLPLLLWVLAPALHGLPERARRAIEAAGNLTYASYLLHFPLQLLIALAFAALHRPVPLYSARFFLAFLSAVFALSAVVYHAFEMPMQAMLRRLALR